ncbi:related to GPI13 - protein involved in glycosylphosphatidylinositol biosynthesis [Melanopsichium pennsylvanicum]|uniref:Related to GPI13 - protein involved in glycosylphosphatidylinositol biosynthesis n=1 Tax=Melanopsichium pennsylvanicum TaxID=63383 RepID=A0AAJ4XNN3_9BASI|nr:related to GPI13 - protein involved in glycosylphosphatidylinositol biosynthesis [Melanopsichium pennsylvanicum]
MPNTSVLNPAPTLAEIQRNHSNATSSAPSSTPQHPAFGTSLRRRRPSSSSHSSSHSHSHGSDSSHSSHSSYARRHPDRVPQKAASPNTAFLSTLAILTLVLVYTLVGLWLFVKGFLLTRHELTSVNQCSKPYDSQWTLPDPPESFDDQSLLNWANIALNPQTGSGECKLKPTHTKAVVLVIDALRYDFIAPAPAAHADADAPSSVRGDGGWTPNPYYHNILSLPAQLTTQDTCRASSSFLAHFMADPPTTTLQRLKGLTTGTLPTFIEAGANFGSAGTGVGVVREDNWLSQFKASILDRQNVDDASGSATVGFVFAGDDTWATVLPGLFDQKTTWTYDSFNVEDLDTVDRGVEQKLLPFLQHNHPERVVGVHDEWRLLVGHTLGVDHVGHRFGPAHPKMKTKLQEMQTLVSNITESLDEETLFVLMGDHGMDERGDHGGDGELEVGAGIWIYAKTGFGLPVGNMNENSSEYISTPEIEAVLPSRIAFSPLPSPRYPIQGHRSVSQIDLVPTLSLLLGLPVPYNNLGSPIPELLPHSNMLLRALRITATQMRRYIQTYSSYSPDLATFSSEFDQLWLKAIRADAELAKLTHKRGASTQAEVKAATRVAAQAYHTFNRMSLVRAREVWAQFDMMRISVGLVILVLGLGTVWVGRFGAQYGLIGKFSSIQIGQEEEEEEDRERVFERKSESTGELWQVMRWSLLRSSLIGAGVGGLGYCAASLCGIKVVTASLTLTDSILASSAIHSQLGLLYTHLPRIFAIRKAKQSRKNHEEEQNIHSDTLASTDLLSYLGWVILLVHAGLLASNSFLVQEDRFTLLALSSLVLIRGLLLLGSSATTNLKMRNGLLTFVALVGMRLAAIPRVCREEQMPHCHSNFFSSVSWYNDSRMEQQEFQDGDGDVAALNSPYVMAVCYLISYLLPGMFGWFLRQNRSFVGIAPTFLKWIFRPTLMLGSGYWILDYVVPLQSFVEWRERLEWVKNWVARANLILICLIGFTFWIFAPLCLEIRRDTPQIQQGQDGDVVEKVEGEEEGRKKKKDKNEKVTILGYSNSLGSSYMLLVMIGTSLIWFVTQPAGQLAIGASMIAGMAVVEMGDAERDVFILHKQRQLVLKTTSSSALTVTQEALEFGESNKKKNKKKPKKDDALSKRISTHGNDDDDERSQQEEGGGGGGGEILEENGQQSFMVVMLSSSEIATLVLLGYLMFFSTGHQATLPTIQWRVAFLTNSTLTYPISPLLVSLNTFGQLTILPTLLIALRVVWNSTPLPRGSASKMSTSKHLLHGLLSLIMFNLFILVWIGGLGAFFFRRHLMLFKVWVPRIMLASVVSVVGQIVGLMVVFSVWQVVNKVNVIFGSEFV